MNNIDNSMWADFREREKHAHTKVEFKVNFS